MDERISETIFSYLNLNSNEEQFLFIFVVHLLIIGHSILLASELFIMDSIESAIIVLIGSIGLLLSHTLHELNVGYAKCGLSISTLYFGIAYILFVQNFGIGVILCMSSVFWNNNYSTYKNTKAVDLIEL